MLVPLLTLAAPTYRIADLGLPRGAEGAQAVAINARDEVLVSALSRDPFHRDAQGVATLHHERAYLWRAGIFIDLGESPYAGMESTRIVAQALNDRGAVVGAVGGFGPLFMSGLEDKKAFVWNGRGMALLFPKDAIAQEGLDINAQGDIVGNDGHGAFARLRGRIVGLPGASHVEPRDPSGEMGDVNGSNAVAINDRRLILMDSTYGRKEDAGGMPSRPFFVNGDAPPLRLRPVPLPRGFAEGYGLALNESGTAFVVATHRLGADATPCLVRRGVATRLVVPQGVNRLSKGAINAREDAVATAETGPDSTLRLLLWRQGRPAPFPSFPGWTLQTVTGINDRGQICGTGLHDGKIRAYVLTPDG